MKNIILSVSLFLMSVSVAANAATFDLEKECFTGDPLAVHMLLMELDVTPKFTDMMESYPDIGWMTVYQGAVGTPDHRAIFLELCD